MKILLLVFLFLFNSCSSQTKESEQQSRPQTKAVKEVLPTRALLDTKKCTCVQLWLPVCGENGKTYSNSCFAECAGVKYTQGKCKNIITE